MTTWHQVNLHPADAEAALTDHILPIFTGTGAPWFFIRKHPLRVRWRPNRSSADADEVYAALDAAVPEAITAWNPAVYEPETEAFGGEDAMEAAHVFFHADSQHLATALTDPNFAADRATYSTLLAARLIRSAGLDWWEQGDVWAKLTAMRATGAKPDPAWRRRLAALLTRDPWQRPDPRLEPHRPWFDAAAQLGTTLAALTDRGRTTRGLRALLAHHLIFHWNRIGLSTEHQALLAAAARIIYFGTSEETSA